MDIFSSLVKCTELLLTIWVHKEKQRYFEEFRSLQRRLKNEHAKPEPLKDMAVIDNAEFELLLLTRKIIEAASTPSRPDSQS